jgi:hypothetical protein
MIMFGPGYVNQNGQTSYPHGCPDAVKWKQITDVEISKKSGVYHVDKICFMQLMRPDFQINNKMLGQRM